MKWRGGLALLLVAAAAAGCRDAKVGSDNNTAVLGGSAPHAGASGWTDAQGRAIPGPPAPRDARPRLAATGSDAAVAVWVADDQVLASRWTRAGGWTAPRPLEHIYGQASDVALAGNGQGQAMAVWQHRVGNIHSLRFSRLEADAWTVPDVVPGALPRPAANGPPAGDTAAQLQMDAQGNVSARWPSGFHAGEQQVARFTPGEGWSAAAAEPMASALSASPALPAASSAR